MCNRLHIISWFCLSAALNGSVQAQSINLADPLSVCFSDIYKTQIETSSDVDSRSALEIASDSAQGNSHSEGMDIGGSYGPYSAKFGKTASDSYTSSLKTLNKNAFSDRELHSFVMKTLTDQALASLDHCMDKVTENQRGTVTVWPQVTSDPKRVKIHVKFVPGENPTIQASIDLAKNDKQTCEECKPLTLIGGATKDFTIRRENADTPMLATVHIGNSDKTVNIEGYRELKFTQPAASPCLVAPQIIRITPPQGDDSRSRAKDGGYEPVDFPQKQGYFKGAGWLVEPSQDIFPKETLDANLVLHSNSSPNRLNGTIEYEFSFPVGVHQIEVIQHTNGLNRLHAWLTDTKGDYSKGGDLGEATLHWSGLQSIPEGQNDVFVFPEIEPYPIGRYLRVEIQGSVAKEGFGVYRMFPRDRFGARILPAARCDARTNTIY